MTQPPIQPGPPDEGPGHAPSAEHHDPDPYDQGPPSVPSPWGPPGLTPPGYAQPGPPQPGPPQAFASQPGYGPAQPQPYAPPAPPPYGAPPGPYGNPGGFPGQPMPPYPPYPGYSPRRRPHLAWWLIPGLTLLAGFVMFVVPLVQVVNTFASPLAELEAGQRATVSLDESTLVGLWVEDGYADEAESCRMSDSGGARIEFTTPEAPMDYEEDVALRHVGEAEIPAGEWTFDCDRTTSAFAVRLAPVASTAMFAMLGFSLLVGLLGVVFLIVLIVLAATGAPRKPFNPGYPGYPGQPGPPHYPGYRGY